MVHAPGQVAGPTEAEPIRDTLDIRKRRVLTQAARSPLEAAREATKSPKLDPGCILRH